MEKKLRKFIDRKFFLYPKTEKIIEVREELYTIMLDRYRDCLESGLPREESYKNAIEMTQDYRNAVREVETGSSLSAFKKNLVSTASFSTFYFLTLTTLYLLYSMVIRNSFEKTWLIPVGGSFVYLVFSSINTFQYARLFNFRILKRWGVALIFATLVPLFYVFPSLYLATVMGKSVWGVSWLIVVAILFFYLIADFIVNKKHISAIERDLHLLAAGLVLTSLVYLFLSLKYGVWGKAWILYVAYLAIVSLVFYLNEKMGRTG